MMINSCNIYAVFLLLIIAGWIEPMEINNDENRFDLVVDGGITQKEAPHKLFLSRMGGYGYAKRIHVGDTRITLYDSRGNYETYLEDPYNEYYLLSGNLMERKPGESYYIEIFLNENNIYRSRPQIMPDPVTADTVLAEKDFTEELNDYGNIVRKNYVNVFVQTAIKKDQKDLCFIWRVDEAYSFTELKCHPLHNPKVCYIKRMIIQEEMRIFSSENMTEGYLKDFLVARVFVYPLWEHFEKHFYNVAQHVITKDAYQYWETIRKIAQPSGSIFDTPPAPIPGNIYKLGDPEARVFEVSAVNTVRTYTLRQDLHPLTITDRCPYFNWQTANDPPCCECLALANSEIQRPHYWGQ